MSDTRFAKRYSEYKKLLANSPIQQHGSEHQKESLLKSIDNAHRLLSSPKARKAFDLSLESKESYDTYKVGGRFGLGCLLAKRLTEAGARFIEVTHGYYPFKYWDTHDNGHTKMKDLKKMIDAPIAQLVLDLEKSKLLDRTLIVVASEFSRDMMMEGKPEKRVKDQVQVPPRIDGPQHYGMHRHFTGAGSVLLFGGGIKKVLFMEKQPMRDLVQQSRIPSIPNNCMQRCIAPLAFLTIIITMLSSDLFMSLLTV